MKTLPEFYAEQRKKTPKECMEATPPQLRRLYEGETDPLYMWPNPPRGELPW